MGSLADLAGKRVYLDANHIASYRHQHADLFVTNDQPLKGASGVNCLLLSELTLH